MHWKAYMVLMLHWRTILGLLAAVLVALILLGIGAAWLWAAVAGVYAVWS